MTYKHKLLPSRDTSVLALIGFLSISTEILALRMLTPSFGSGTIQTSFVIGTVLLSYAAGNSFAPKVAPGKLCLLILISLTAVILTNPAQHFFRLIMGTPDPDAYLIRLAIVSILTVAPQSFIHGYVYPYFFSESAKVSLRKSLAISTLGAFTGAVGTSLLLRSTVSASEFSFGLTVLTGTLSVFIFGGRKCAFVLPAIAVSIFLNFHLNPKLITSETGVANYEVVTAQGFKGLAINGARFSSMIFSDGKTMPYNDQLHHLYLDHSMPREVLVLGAGGFTLSRKPSPHWFTFVDTDPKIKQVVSRHFDPSPRGKLVVADAREFMIRNRKKFDLIVQDVYDGSPDVPAHLLTVEHFREIRLDLTEDGFFAINLSHRGPLSDLDGTKMARTLQMVFGVCYFSPNSGASLGKNDLSLRQTLAICQNNSAITTPRTDDSY